MKDWAIKKITNGYKPYYVLYHEHHLDSMDPGHVCGIRNGKWMCCACDERVPKEIQFLADLSGCVNYEIPSKVYK